MTDLAHEEEPDSLARLEERIQKVTVFVADLRRERDQAVKEASALARELESLRSERAQVRKRIEKLLGQIDLLSST